ncbi:protein MpCYP815A1 [Marchantia polymorpha subsp. ruderalis]
MSQWGILLEGGAIIFFVAVLFTYGAAGLKWLRLTPALRKRYRKLPKGSLGWPLVGETFAFQHCLMSTTPHSFVDERRRRYGDLFLTHLFGTPLLASTDPDMNKFILTKEEPLFTSTLPKSISMAVGENALLMLRGDRHKRMRRLVLSVFSPEVLKHKTGSIQASATSILKTWKGRKVIVADDAREYTFYVAMNAIIDMGQDRDERSEVFRNRFLQLRAGARALPIDLPGTAFRKAVQARKHLKTMVETVIDERKRSSGPQYDDLLAKLLRASESDGGEPLKNEEIVDVVLSSLLAGFDTSANTLLFLVYYIGQHPQVLHDLKVEHQEILKDKPADEPLSYSDYKRMKLTQSTINETLRLANPVLSLHRRTLQDVEYNGRMVPANSPVQVWLRSLHTDPDLYPQPYNFDVDRWKGKASTNNFIPFGLGPRLCVGMDLARMELSIFVHCLVTMYRTWELAEEDAPRFFPEPGMKKGLPIFVHDL